MKVGKNLIRDLHTAPTQRGDFKSFYTDERRELARLLVAPLHFFLGKVPNHWSPDATGLLHLVFCGFDMACRRYRLSAGQSDG